MKEERERGEREERERDFIQLSIHFYHTLRFITYLSFQQRLIKKEKTRESGDEGRERERERELYRESQERCLSAQLDNDI